MPLPVTDRSANKPELIVHAAEILRKSPHRQLVFKAIHSGKRKIKTVVELAETTELTQKQVLQAGKVLARNELVEQTKSNGKTAYEKIDFFQSHLKKIFNAANNDEARMKIPTKRNAHFIGKPIPIPITVHINPSRVNIKLVTVDDIDSFAEVKKIQRGSEFIKIPEKKFKEGIGNILGEILEFKDWGGEISDLYSSNLVIGNERKTVAFAFKGPGTKGSLTPGKFGKNGDQIQRLVESPAEVYVIQYWMDIKESVISQFEKLLSYKSQISQRQFQYAVIDGYDSARLIKAYPNAFEFPLE